MKKKYKLEKTTYIARILEKIRSQNNTDETLKKVTSVILEKVEFYDDCLKSWDNPSEKFSSQEIEIGKKCCDAGINMADAITNELRIMFIK